MFGDNGSVLVEQSPTLDSVGLNAGAPSITIPDTELLFHGDFKRAGNDLKIVGSDGKAFIVHDYFKTDRPPALLAPNGASLTAEIVAALAGPLAPGQYAQAGAAAGGAAPPIGHVVTVTGSATAVRNGVAITLNIGDAIYKGDVVQTTGDSTLGVIFNDNSTFNLGANARMVLNEFVYDPNGSANASAISLVQGTISFLAGTIAHTGDMKVGTPVGTMGIRGTAVNVIISANNGATQISVMAEADNLTHSVNVYAPPTPADLAAGQTVGALLGVVTNSTGVFFFNPTPTGVLVQETGKSVALLQQEQSIVQQVFQTQAVGQQFLQAAPNTQHAAGTQIIVSDTLATDKSGSGIKTGDVSTTKVTITDQGNADSNSNNNSGSSSTVHPPIANADVNAVVEAGVKPTNVPFAGTAVVTGNVLANDLDPDVGNTNYLKVSDLNAVSAQIHGTITIGADGTYTYTLNNANPLTQALAVGETAVDVFSYVVTNTGGYTSNSTLSITITGTDDAPIIAPQATIISAANTLPSDAGKNNWAPKASADGHFIVYEGSDALPASGQSTAGHVYFYNSITNTTALIDPATAHAGELFSHASISFDGRYVAFEGDYTDQSGAHAEIFVYDRDTGQTALLSDPTTHTTISGANPTISANGQFIAMEHGGNEIVVADRNGTVVSTIAAAGIGDPVIDASGRFVAFQTSAASISIGGATVAGAHSDGTLELYVYDRAANTIQAVAALEAPAQNDGNVAAPASVSVSAGTIAFASDVNLLALPGVNGNGSEVYVAKYDQASQTYSYTLVSAANDGTPANGSSFGAQVSPDGSYVTFSSTATNLVPGADSGQQQTYVYNLLTNTIQLVSSAADGTPGTGASSFPAAVSLGGGQVAFGDTAANLVPGGSNGASSIFLVDLSGGTKSAVTEDVGTAASTVLKTSGALAFSDVDLSDTHIVSVAAQSGALGTLTATLTADTTGTGTGGSISWNYQVTEGAAESLGAFETHVDTFLVTVDDQHGGTSTQTVTVTIIGTQPLVTEPIFWTYTAGGDFATPLNWSSDSVPGAGDDVGLIDHSGTYAVTSWANESVRTVSGIAGTTLEIAAGVFAVSNGTGIGGNSGTIAVDNGATLQFGGPIDNSGLISLGAINSATQFRVAGNATLSGHGHLTLSDSAQNAIVSNGSAAMLTNVDNTISGAGTIGDANLTLVNQAAGVIDANGQNALRLSSLSLSNAGTLEATGAELDLTNSTVTNTGTVLVTGTNATIRLSNSTIDGGAVTVAGATNTIVAISGVNFIDNATITNAGSIEANGGTLTIDPSTVTNTGTLEAAASSLLVLSDTVVGNAGGTVIATGANATIELESATINGGTVSIVGAGALIEATAGVSTISGATTFANGGTLKADGGELDLSNETVTNTGSVVVASGSTLKLDNVALTGGTINNAGTVDIAGSSSIGNDTLGNAAAVLKVEAGQTLTLSGTTVTGGTITDNGGIDIAGSSTINGGAHISNGQLTVEAGQTLDLDGVTVTGTTVTANGTIQVTVSSTISGGTMSIGSAGLVQASAGATLHIDDPLNNLGLLEANGAIVVVNGAVTGTGSATIAGGGTLVVGSSFAQAVNFSGAGTLTLDQPGDFSGHIGGLALGDVIDFSGVTIKSAVIGAANGGSILTVTESNNQTVTYQIAGSLGGNYFNILSDNAGGSDLVLTQVPPNWAGDTLVAFTQVTTSAGINHIAFQQQYLSFTVPAAGIPEANNTFKLSFDSNSITASNFVGSHTWDGPPQDTFDGFVISDQTQSNISGVTIDPSTNMVGLTLANISFTSNTIKVNWGGLSYTPNTIVKLDITFDPQIDASQFSTIPTLDGSAAPAVNAGTLTVADGTALALAGVIDNTGTIVVDALNAVTGIEIGGDVTLQGGGHFVLSQSNQNYVFGSDATLTNVDNTISGSGDFGNGSLVFHNAGTVEAAGPYALIIDTGAHDFVNTGTLETGGGTLMVHSPVTGGGNAIIAGGTLEFFGASDNNVTFTSPGVLALDQSQAFTGHVSGFGAQDQIDLSDISFSATTTLGYAANGNGGGVLTVSDGTHTANLALLGDYSPASFALSSDQHGGTTLSALVNDAGQTVSDGTLIFTGFDSSSSEVASVTPDQPGYIGSFSVGAVTQSNGVASVAFEFSLGNDQILVPGETVTQSYSVSVADAENPATAATQTVTVSIGGAGHDDFVFHPGIGTATVLNFNPQIDTIELDGFANAHTVEQLQSAISSNAHGDAVIDLGHNDSITLSGTTLAQLQHVLTTAVLLH